jgi:drug/metabolite transporter (DMT)-like permease
MRSSHFMGVLFGLVSAFLWGGGDFSGGFSTRRISQFQALVASASSALAVLLILAGMRGEIIRSPADFLWASSAGFVGAVGIAALYRALAVGNAAVVAPRAAVIGAALPVLFGSLSEGFPGFVKILGFVVGGLGIWLVTGTASEMNAEKRQALWLAILAGIAFGGYYILIAQVQPGTLFVPLAIARVSYLGLGMIMLFVRREKLPSLRGNPIALLAGILDAGGNVFFLMAEQFTRLDVAVVLSSLYPASTVILSRLVLDEQVSRTQWVGVGFCVLAISLIAI